MNGSLLLANTHALRYNSCVRKTFKYRLYPNKQQQRLLEQQLEECRWLYNHLLAERRAAWEERRESLRLYDQHATLPALKAERPTLAGVQSQILQNVAVRIDLAFKAFFRRCAAGETPGYPRFRGKGRYDSITFPQVPVGCRLDMDARHLRMMNIGQLRLPRMNAGGSDPLPLSCFRLRDPRFTVRRGLRPYRAVSGGPSTGRARWLRWHRCCDHSGQPPRENAIHPLAQAKGLSGGEAVKVILHRPLEGVPKSATIRRSRTGKWYVSFSCECTEPSPLQKTGHQVGIDVGLKTFAALSTGEDIANPRFFCQEEKALAKAQRCLSKAEQGTPERAERRKVVARVYERVAWRRGDFSHQHSRHIVDSFDVIAVEDLAVNRMTHHHCLAKSIHDAAWSQFADLLSYKAAWAGRRYVAVNPAYTSQDCSQCGHRQTLPLSDRIYPCPCCGVVLDRDFNASLNILGVGLHTLGLAPRSSRIYPGE